MELQKNLMLGITGTVFSRARMWIEWEVLIQKHVSILNSFDVISKISNEKNINDADLNSFKLLLFSIFFNCSKNRAHLNI